MVKLSNYLLGIDIGTTGTKAIIFDEKGGIKGAAHEEYDIISPKPQWIEQDVEIWWRALKNTVKTALKGTGVRGEEIQGVGTAVLTPAVVPVDRKGTPLRNAILMIDRRSVKQAEWIKEHIGENRIFEITGNRIAPGAFSAPSILWIKENEPRIYERTHKFLNVNGYVVNRMTDEFSTDYTQASASLIFEMRRKRWSEEILDFMDLSMDKLPTIYPSSGVVGTLSTRAAEELHIKSGVPIVAGANDTSCACVGAGAVKNGTTFISIGTTIVFVHLTETPRFDLRLLNRLHAVPGLYLMMGAISTAGAAYRWLRDQLCDLERIESLRLKVDPYRLMDEKAERSTLGANGLIAMPYFSGERAPIWNPNARGMLFGLTLNHTKADVIRAFLEGAAYCARDILEVLISRGVEINRIRIGGGGAKSKLWRQIIADVLEYSILLPQVTEAGALGAAITAGVGSGIYPNFDFATARLVSCIEAEKPDKGRSKVYLMYYGLFKRIYESVKEHYDELKDIEDRTSDHSLR